MTTRSRFALAAAWIVLSAVATAATPPADPKQDEKRAADLRLRADKGDGDAALQIGYLLALGRIPAPRYGTPITWFKKGCTARSLAACAVPASRSRTSIGVASWSAGGSSRYLAQRSSWATPC